jgi:hypothetical protein
MRHVAAALAAAKTVPPYEGTSSREPVEKDSTVKVAKRRRIGRRIHVSDAWKPSDARS